MSTVEALSVGDKEKLVVKLHPTVVFSILNNFVRRNDRESRVIGTLLGTIKDGVVEVTESFAVPHMERKDELFVAINKEYHKQMISFHRRINRKERIVGWYTTTSPEGALINDNSSLIHDFYSAECENPIHIVVDTTLAGDTMSVRGFNSVPLSLGDMSLANMFREVQVDLTVTDAESTCLYHMIHSQQPAGSSADKPWASSEILSAVPTQRATVNAAMNQLLVVLDDVQRYVDSVVDNKNPAVAEYGMKIADAIAALQSVRPEEFNSVLQEKIQDLLMVSYISSLTSTQLQLSEKINQIL
jgi:translation initiation factor 3 subunit F